MKLIQLNIWHGILLKNALRFLKAEKPDILNLQEVAVSRKVDVFSTLKEELGMDGVYARVYGMKTKQHGLVYSGNSVLTRFDILRSRTVFYDFPFRTYNDKHPYKQYHNIEGILTEPKNFLSVTLKTPHGTLRTVSTHLAWSERCAERLLRIQQARKLVASIKGKMPTVLSGDFNTHPTSTSFSIINDSFTNLGKGMKNTLNPKRHKLFRDLPRGIAVDYVLGRGVKGRARIANVDVSDHLPLVADIRL